jgi:hypothetical protein
MVAQRTYREKGGLKSCSPSLYSAKPKEWKEIESKHHRLKEKFKEAVPNAPEELLYEVEFDPQIIFDHFGELTAPGGILYASKLKMSRLGPPLKDEAEMLLRKFYMAKLAERRAAGTTRAKPPQPMPPPMPPPPAKAPTGGGGS